MAQLTHMEKAVQTITNRMRVIPEIALILGSGLGDLCSDIEDPQVVPYEILDGFPRSTVEGHLGQLVMGTIEGCPVIAMQGRFHLYEGYSSQDVAYPIGVMKRLGIETLIVTNAAGGLNPSYQAGDLMLITDHLNFTGVNPLAGKPLLENGPRFRDLTAAYSANLQQIAIEASCRLKLKLHQGVYASITGPNYLTSAELKMLRFLGGDAIGMSTVPEMIIAAGSGMKCLGISCITDRATGEEMETLSHKQVIEVANSVKPKFIGLVREILKEVTDENSRNYT